MISNETFLELYELKDIKTRKLVKLSNKLFDGKHVRGGCIFTAIGSMITAISAAASRVGGTVAAAAATAASVVGLSSVPTAAATGIATGAATIAGEKIVKAIVK